MEEILDQPFNENEKDETRINRGIASIRLLICLRFSYFVYSMLDPRTVRVFGNTISGIASLFLILIIVYNLRRILSEIKENFIVVKKYKGFVLLMILIHLVLIAGFVLSIFGEIYSGLGRPFSLKNIEPTLLILGLCIITFREITYFIRATRLKRLNNE